MDKLTKSTPEKVPWCILFGYDKVLVNETKNGVHAKLKFWWDTLGSKCSWLSRIKTYYMEYKFSKKIQKKNERVIRLYGQEIIKKDSFRYLGSIIHKNWEIEMMWIIG